MSGELVFAKVQELLKQFAEFDRKYASLEKSVSELERLVERIEIEKLRG